MAERRSPGRRLRSPALVALALVVGALLPVPSAATAQTASAPAVELRLRRQTTWWSPEQPFTLALAVETAAPEALEVAISVYGKLPTRTAFAASVEGRTSGRPVQTHVVPLADAAADEAGALAVTFAPNVRVDGVFPLRVEVRPIGGGSAAAGFVTHLVSVPASLEADRLAVAAVVPVHAPPATQPDGTVAIDDERAELLGRLATGLGTHPEVPLTLAPTPETVEALAASPRDEDGDTLEALVRSLRGRQLLAGPYVPTNLTSMVAAGLGEETAGQLTRGTEILRRAFGVEPTTTTRLVDERLSDEALGQLQSDQGVTKVVVPEELLEPVTRNTTLTETFTMASRRGAVAAVAADTSLAGHLTTDDPVLGAQHLLADLAVLYNDDPGQRRRGVVVAPPRSWEPSTDAVDTLLRGLATSPILVGVGIDGLFDVVDVAVSGTGARATPLVRRVADPPGDAPIAPTLPGAAIRAARARIDAFASAVDTDAEGGRAVIDRLDRTLLAAPSVDLRARDRLRYLAGVRDQLGEQLAAIEMPAARSITLTAREGEIPVTVTNRLGYPVRVVLRVSGRPLMFPEGDAHDLELLRENTTSQFAVEAPSSGSFPIRIRLETPTGGLEVDEATFTVRSTAISGVGTALSVGAGLFLVVWWGNHLRGRRSKRLVPA